MSYKEFEGTWKQMRQVNAIVPKPARQVLKSCHDWTENILQRDLHGQLLDKPTFIVLAGSLREAVFNNRYHRNGLGGNGTSLDSLVHKRVSEWLEAKRILATGEVMRDLGTSSYVIDQELINLQAQVRPYTKKVADKYYDFTQAGVDLRPEARLDMIAAISVLSLGMDRIREFREAI